MVLSAYVLPQGCQLLFNSSSFGGGGRKPVRPVRAYATLEVRDQT